MALITLFFYFSSFKTLFKNLLSMSKVFIIKYFKQLILKIIKVKLLISVRKSENPKLIALKDNKLEDIVVKALRLEFKTVNKLYVFNSILVST
jgi:hypothetical protein